MAMLAAVGMTSYATYKFNANKSQAKTLYDDVINENKVNQSGEKLLM